MPAHMKPKKGTAAAERRKRRAAIETAERKAKRAAKERDNWQCRRCGQFDLTFAPIEAAHISDKGMGGDHGTRSGKAADYLTLCHDCHQGPRSLHSGHVRVVITEAMGDGDVLFIDQVPGARHGRCAVDGGVHTEGPFCKAFRPQ